MITAHEIMALQEQLTPLIKARLHRLGRDVLWRGVHSAMIDASAEAFKKELRDLAAKALERINERLDEFCVKELKVCPKCSGEVSWMHFESVDCAFGETYVPYCMECGWEGQPE